MTILFGTLGWRPESLIPSIKSTKDLEKLVIYHSDHEDSIKTRDKVVQYCDTIGLETKTVVLRKPFNLIGIAERIKKDVEEAEADGIPIRFNIAGGTRLMSSAALLVCILKGIPTTYVHDDSFEEIQLPLLRMDYAKVFTKQQRKILDCLLELDAPINQTDLAEKLGIHKATMNHHIKKLNEKGAVEISKKKGDARASLISLAPHMNLLLE
ncbi:MAG: MarR family transcriptional regulator [Thermoplasmata archaeon]|nr:MarR family transcriptional regulator [Thermoplasmata archaeon]